MAEKKTINIIDNIDVNLEKISGVENYISQILAEDGFYKMNVSRNRKSENLNKKIYKQNIKIKDKNNEEIEFICLDENSLLPYSNLITEKEFYKIVGVRNKKLLKSCGKYQESLYSNYLEAKKEQDEGYISDILQKAVVFQNNLNYVKTLSKNKKFMKEWRKNFGKETPTKVFKNNGSLRKINIVHELCR